MSGISFYDFLCLINEKILKSKAACKSNLKWLLQLKITLNLNEISKNHTVRHINTKVNTWKDRKLFEKSCISVEKLVIYLYKPSDFIFCLSLKGIFCRHKPSFIFVYLY